MRAQKSIRWSCKTKTSGQRIDRRKYLNQWWVLAFENYERACSYCWKEEIDHSLCKIRLKFIEKLK